MNKICHYTEKMRIKIFGKFSREKKRKKKRRSEQHEKHEFKSKEWCLKKKLEIKIRKELFK